ncbi:uncharacterized protein LOC116738647 [Nasonia vitripennis]|uniref:Uncharacterized protein n=1 Tax=Nasonia vitripennis TaxID=7425 RepID=A0A7M7R0S8_NASVI|nr:uncharacterized protein LOC116738647 [Nasonia vitripennis]
MRQAFENIYKLLRPGGQALILFVANHVIFETYPKLYDYPKYQAYMEDYLNFVPYFQNHDDAGTALKKMIQGSGFEVLHCCSRKRTCIFKNWEIVKSKQKNISRFMFLDSFEKDIKGKKYKEDLLREVSNFEYAFLTQGNELSEQPKLFG